VELLAFVKEYLASPKYVGGFAPSSRGLAEIVTEAAGVSEAGVVAEFGPGTGVFTEATRRKLRAGARFFAIEISEDFVKLLQRRCPDVRVFHGSAADVKRYMAELGVDSCDCIVSGLPFALFEDALQDAILNAALEALRPGGVFVTFTYVTSPYLPRGWKLRRKLRALFGSVEKTRTVWLNVFPAFAYRCVK